jgi:WD40 repeat protein
MAASPPMEKHDGEALACAYTSDGALVLSAGWDGHLRLWEASSGASLTSVRVSPKPLSACAVTPDGRQWVAGSMEGLLTFWDAHTHKLLTQYAGHTRPVSAIRFSPEGRVMATASWDRTVSLADPAQERDGQTFTVHADIVGGCCFLPDGAALLTWSHDGTLRLWDIETSETSENTGTLTGHRDRVTAAAVSPDGRWAASGSRLGEVILWDLEAKQGVANLEGPTEVRGCFFLLDGTSLLVVDAEGRLTLLSVPELGLQSQLASRCPVQCGELAPWGGQVALGCSDGQVRFVAVEGLEDQPLVVTAKRTTRRTASRWQRLFGRSQETCVFECTCPTCRRPVEQREKLPSEPTPCPHCRRPLRYNRKTLHAEKSPC